MYGPRSRNRVTSSVWLNVGATRGRVKSDLHPGQVSGHGSNLVSGRCLNRRSVFECTASPCQTLAAGSRFSEHGVWADGRRKASVLAPSRALRTVMFPPRSSTLSFDMARPSPVPGNCRVVAILALKASGTWRSLDQVPAETGATCEPDRSRARFYEDAFAR
jgi:hypothetical protein